MGRGEESEESDMYIHVNQSCSSLPARACVCVCDCVSVWRHARGVIHRVRLRARPQRGCHGVLRGTSQHSPRLVRESRREETILAATRSP